MNELLIAIFILAGSAITSLIFGNNRKLMGIINFTTCLVATLLVVTTAINIFNNPVQIFHYGSGWLKVPVLLDGYAALFLILISIMASIVAFYCIGYMEFSHYVKYSSRLFYFYFPLYIMGMLALIVVDLSTGFSIAWQIMTLTSYALIRFENDNRQIVFSANKYLLMMEIAWVLILIGALIIPNSNFGDDINVLKSSLTSADNFTQIWVFALILTGFAIKAGMFPFGQIWLPDAHTHAPSPISALLSGVMIKTGVYGIGRTFFWMMPEGNIAGAFGLILAFFGVMSLFLGTVQALKQHDAKRLHAYHSIGQMGYILLALGLAQYFMNSPNPDYQPLAILLLIGAFSHLLHHAVFKALLFLTTGSVQFATGTKDIDKLGGLYKLLPITTFCAAIASASIAGLPIFSGFASKWEIISGSMLAGHSNALFAYFGIIALITSAITLASYIKFFGMSFTASGVEWTMDKTPREVSCTMYIPQLVLVGIALVQGLIPMLTISLIFTVFLHTDSGIIMALMSKLGGLGGVNDIVNHNIAGVSFMNGQNTLAMIAPITLLILIVVVGVVITIIRKMGGSETRVAPVWLGSYQQLNSRNSYQSSHIYASFKKFMKWTGGESSH